VHRPDHARAAPGIAFDIPLGEHVQLLAEFHPDHILERQFAGDQQRPALA